MKPQTHPKLEEVFKPPAQHTTHLFQLVQQLGGDQLREKVPEVRLGAALGRRTGESQSAQMLQAFGHQGERTGRRGALRITNFSFHTF